MIKKVLFGFLMIVLFLISIEGGLHLVNWTLSSTSQKKDMADELGVYQDKQWAKDLFQELEQANRHEYEPFIEWQTKEYHGQYVNVETSGARKTWNPEHFLGKESKAIYMFGGSTLWGYGARDDYTIPSHLSKLLNKKGYTFIVNNFGEHAYTFTQEILRLILLLKDGERPNFVIFYDGVNDVYSAYQSGTPGTIQALADIREKLNKEDPTNSKHIRVGVKGLIQGHSLIYRTLAKISHFLLGETAKAALQENKSANNELRLKRLAGDVAEEYIKSLRLLDHLSKAYGFKYICLWQPGLPDELAKMYEDAGNALTQKSIPHFFNIAKELEDKINPYYFDWTHLTEEGNEIVATKIFKILEKNLR